MRASMVHDVVMTVETAVVRQLVARFIDIVENRTALFRWNLDSKTPRSVLLESGAAWKHPRAGIRLQGMAVQQMLSRNR
jgi:hypothetical protein